MEASFKSSLILFLLVSSSVLFWMSVPAAGLTPCTSDNDCKKLPHPECQWPLECSNFNLCECPQFPPVPHRFIPKP